MFQVDQALLEESGRALAADSRVHWLLGGSGSGKSTVCRALHTRLGVTVLDMDSRIYGTYHASFSPSRHPVSCQWSAAKDGMSWLLDMTWVQFEAFNRASLPEYVDLLSRELQTIGGSQPVLVDGGIWHPALLATILEPARIICMRRDDLDASTLWVQPGARSEMRRAAMGLDATGAKWARFLEFDDSITSTVATEAAEAGIAECVWSDSDSPSDVADRVASSLQAGDLPGGSNGRESLWSRR